MEIQKQEIKQLCSKFMLNGMGAQLDTLVSGAEKKNMGFMQFTLELLQSEADHRQSKDQAKRIKAAGLRKSNNLAYYDAEKNGLKTVPLAQLRELNWIDQLFNIVLMGSSGTGKTFLAAGLAADAVKAGYRAYFGSMEDIVNTLKTKDFGKSQMIEYKRLLKANMIVLNDIMRFHLEKNIAVAFFNFINHIYESTSIVITTNKKPTEWAKMLDDEVIATALLDRLLFRCEMVNLTGESYRLENRQTFFES
ncbi:IS21-like element helper ATPase IstB [Pedobacter sp. JCM 36344]|uniref:IS21-like element helper ATPase IstB n=1 Tax=Pedobacter sp. JCM 36344 TaxID=3374280 RepID=UPI003979E3C4